MPNKTALAVLLLSFSVLSFPAAAQDQNTIVGTAEIIDGKTLKIDGQTLVLADIVIPEPGVTCIFSGKERDCGVIAKSSLQDLTAAVTMTCSLADANHYRCVTDEDFDVAFGQIHAGYAIPSQDAPDHYHERAVYAQSREHGFWKAVSSDGYAVFLETLRD